MRALIFNFLFLALVPRMLMAASLTPQHHEQCEQVIAHCEAKMSDVLDARERIVSIKNPGLLAKDRKNKKKLFQHKNTILAAFDSNFSALLRLSHEKSGMRNAKSERELYERSNAYSSNCTRFSDSLIEFTSWALKGKLEGDENARQVKNLIFQEWLMSQR